MKRLVLSAIAVSMLAASAMQGQAAPFAVPASPKSDIVQVDWKKPTNHDVKKKIIKKQVIRKQAVRKSQWRNGQRYGDWRKHQPVRDWQRYHLRRPGAGQEWIRVGNDYILVSVLSGVIAGIMASN